MYSTVIKMFSRIITIEEGSIQKARQTVVVLDWGARSNAALGNFGLKMKHRVLYIAVVQFLFTFVGVAFYVCRFVFQVFNMDLMTTLEVSRNSRKSPIMN